MKITALIGSILAFMMSLMVAILFSKVFSGNGPTFIELFQVFSFTMGAFQFEGTFLILLYISLLLIFLSSCFKTNKTLLIGSILCIFSLFLSLIGWVTAEGPHYIYKNTYNFGAVLFAISFIVYFVGLVKFKDKNKVAWIFGIFVLLIVLVANLGIGFIGIGTSGVRTNIVNTHLLTLIIQNFFLAIFGIIFSFSKKSSKWEGYQAEDELSVSSGNAFASYVPDDSAYTSNYGVKSEKKKKKKKESTDDFDFNF